MKPHIAISCGDPAGIGPEVVARCLQNSQKICYPVVFGHWPSFSAALKTLEIDFPAIVLTDVPTRNTTETVQFVHRGPGDAPILKPGMDNALAQLEALRAATDAVLAGTCDALSTAPVSKIEISRLLPEFIGHTEFLAKRCGQANSDVTMVFASENLTVGLVATHLPLKDIPSTITRSHYTRTLHHVVEVVRAIRHVEKPLIGVAALNPHGGEDGLLGNEEIQTIGPFCRAFSDVNNLSVKGPIPADTLFRDALAGHYDGVVAAYHDQAMIPLKLAGIGATVNITMGLPFYRTSPDHGVARDLAGTGRANPAGMARAIEMAVLLVADSCGRTSSPTAP